MLSEPSLKHSSTTLQSQSKLQRICIGNCESEGLINKLHKILASLYAEGSAKDSEVEELKQEYERKLREKDEVIERVTFANAKLVDENQMLSQMLKLEKRKKQKNQIQFISAQKHYETKLQQLEFLKTYLQGKNQEYRSQIAAMQPLKPNEQHTLKKSCAPQSLKEFEPIRSSRRLAADEKYCKVKVRYLNPEKGSTSRRNSLSHRKKSKSNRKGISNLENVKLEIPITMQEN